jgi:hypothetical protein
MSKRSQDNITLGSGKVYITEYTGELPTVETVCTEANRVGYSQGGAELTYTEEVHEERDDLGYAVKIVTISEEAILKLGLITWNGTSMQKLIDRCQVTEDKTKGTRTIHIGGAGNAQGKNWVVCFHHHDAEGGDLWIMIVGRNTTGLTLTFAVDAGSKLEPEFKAIPHDAKGTLITLIEEIDKTTT